MKEDKGKIRRAEWVLVILLLLAILLPQLIGTGTQGGTGARDIASAEDLKHATFAAVTGSAFAGAVEKEFPDARLVYVSDWADECILVDQGKADAMVRERSSLEQVRLEYPSLMPLPDPIGEQRVLWAAQKTAAGRRLADEVNAFLAEAEKQNLQETVYRRWEDPDTAPDRVEDFPMTGTPKGELSIVSCLDWPPVSYQNGSHACGYMIEMLYRFCAYAGYTPVIEYVSVQASLAGFAAGKYDLYGYGTVYREDAAESMVFTEPLLVEPLYAMIRRDRYLAPEGTEAGTEEDAEPRRSLWESLAHSVDLNFVREERWKMVLSGLGITAALSALSALLGTALGGVICAMRMSRGAWPNAFARIFITVIQGTPIVMLLLVLYYVLFRSVRIEAFWVCVLGFSLDFSAYAAEIFRTGIEAIPEGQARAARALGFTPFGVFRKITLPQLVINCLPVYTGQLISTVKLTSVAGYISVQDLTRVSDIIRSRTYEAFFPLVFTALVYFGVARLLTLGLGALERRLDPSSRKRQVKGVRPHADQD